MSADSAASPGHPTAEVADVRAENAPHSDSVSTQGGMAADSTPSLAPPPPATPAVSGSTQASAFSIASLVCGLLLMIPVLTQVGAIVLALVALARRRDRDERMVAAWIGMILGGLGLIGWITVFNVASAYRATGITAGPSPYVGGWTAPADENGPSLKPAGWKNDLERIHAGAQSFREDFDRWPISADELLGQYISAQPPLSAAISFFGESPDAADLPLDWIYVYTSAISYDLEGRPMNKPHAMVLRVDGTVEMIPASQLNDELARQRRVRAADRQPAGGG